MKRHSIIARLGPTDTTRIKPHERGSQVTEVRYIDGKRRLGYKLGAFLNQLNRRGVFPSDEAVDLGLLAATVTAADTRISRQSDAQDSWTREIDLYVPVREPDLWSERTELIERTLNFLTGDRWRIYFRSRHRDYREIVQAPDELIEAPFDSVCLFSGGLDSLVGAIDLLEEGRSPLLVSHYWDASTSSQTVCAQKLGTVYGDIEPRHVRARIGFEKGLVASSSAENTLRGRSFLFFAMAVMAVSGLSGGAPVYVPENGLISLNIPLDPLRIGACSTRTTHPFYMARWNELLTSLGIQTALDNPYRFDTKGEMLENCQNKELLRKCVADTISCSSYDKGRWKKLSPGHCGYCVPCLIRRASIEKALGSDPTTYPAMPSLTARTLDAGKAEGEHVRSFQMMSRRLKRQPRMASILVHKAGPLSDYTDDDVALFANVFRRGIKEVDELVRNCVVRPL